MQNTNTKTARKIVRKICAEQGVRVSAQSYTNRAADEDKRNLCFIVDGLTDSVVEHIALNLNVDAVRRTNCKFYYGAQAQYLRLVGCTFN